MNTITVKTYDPTEMARLVATVETSTVHRMENHIFEIVLEEPRPVLVLASGALQFNDLVRKHGLDTNNTTMIYKASQLHGKSAQEHRLIICSSVNWREQRMQDIRAELVRMGYCSAELCVPGVI